jgi:hypothetical protein
MTRKLKLLVLALVAVFAMSAISATSAFALKMFKAESPPVKLTGIAEALGEGEAEEEEAVEAGVVKCKGSTYTGIQGVANSSELQLNRSYGTCTIGKFKVTINPNGCEQVYKITGEEGGVATGTMDITCSGANEITETWELFATVKCTIHIPPQKGLGPVKFTNLGTGATRELTIDINITNLKYSQTAGIGGEACATADNKSNGKYTGKILLTGENEAGTVHRGFWVE